LGMSEETGMPAVADSFVETEDESFPEQSS
jgi:hypothetical protein